MLIHSGPIENCEIMLANVARELVSKLKILHKPVILLLRQASSNQSIDI